MTNLHLLLHSTAFVVAGHFDDALGKKFEILAGEQCFDEIITSYDGLKGKFGVIKCNCIIMR